MNQTILSLNKLLLYVVTFIYIAFVLKQLYSNEQENNLSNVTKLINYETT